MAQIVINESKSRMSTNLNHILYVCNKSKVDVKQLSLNSFTRAIKNHFTGDDNCVYTGGFIKQVLNDRDDPDFLSRDELNDVLHAMYKLNMKKNMYI